jgi:anti-sigma B factor antagonist
MLPDKGHEMQIQVVDDGGATAKVVLTGKLDIAGAEVIALPLATLSGSKSGVTIDMSGVTFIASIGIRHLVSASKALRRRGGALELLNPNDMVTEVLVSTGVSDFMIITRTDGSVGAAAKA